MADSMGFAFGAVCGAAAAAGLFFLWSSRRTSSVARSRANLEVYSLKGKFYQVLGHAWDHETKQFKVIYRPLYHCLRKAGSFEAHTLASSHFSRWESKFRRVEDIYAELDNEAKAYLLDGPFVADPAWTFPLRTLPVEGVVRATSSPSCSSSTSSSSIVPLERSHEPAARLGHLIGEVETFVETIHATLLEQGLDCIARGYEMDHVCFRCETVEEYHGMLEGLVPRFGRVLVEGMIGKRPIATVLLHEPIQTPSGYSVSCLEIPCPKAGRPYASGLEHAEIVVGQAPDGVAGNAVLKRFMAEHASIFTFDTRAMDKAINADVCVSFETDKDFSLHSRASATAGATAKKISVKFHQRPLYEVCAYELEHDAVEAVPEGYFAGTEAKA